MAYPASIYVTSNGEIIGASQTDQRHTRTPEYKRTYRGKPVVYAGDWYGSQMAYRPFRDAVARAAAKAAAIASGL